MRIHCPSCGQAIVAEDVNLTQVVAKCRACHAVFRFETQLSEPRPPRIAPAVERVPLPDGMRVEKEESIVPGDYRHAQHESGRLTIVRRWFSARYIPLIPFCIAWDAFLVFWYATGVTSGGPWIMFVFPIAHVAVGVGLTYSTLAGLVNRTIVSVDDGRLRVRHGPMPWLGNRDVDARSIRQLYSEQHTTSGKNPRTHFSLVAITNDGPSVTLVKNLDSSRQALYLEQELEQHLGIADAHVPGSIAREDAA